jgi:ATP-binding cassette, subfamily F, member 3
VCNKIWYIENFQIKEYPGKLSEYLYSQQLKIKNLVLTSSNSIKKKSIKTSVVNREEQKEFRKEIKSLKKNIVDIDTEIANLEKIKVGIELSLSDPIVYTDGNKLNDLTNKLGLIENDIENRKIRWIEAYNKLEKMSSGDF